VCRDGEAGHRSDVVVQLADPPGDAVVIDLVACEVAGCVCVGVVCSARASTGPGDRVELDACADHEYHGGIERAPSSEADTGEGSAEVVSAEVGIPAAASLSRRARPECYGVVVGAGRVGSRARVWFWFWFWFWFA
jgi:hypothetical protein